MTIADTTAPAPENLTERKDFFGHPPGLWYLAFTEAWERFSYYGMQALLALYMVKYLLEPDRIARVIGFEHVRAFFGGMDGQPLASAITGGYFALVYLTPIAGGLIADRWLGKRITVLIGALTMSAGHFMMASEPLFLFALLALVIGVGLFKGNIASQVGALYKPEDLRRADAFQIFYLGINAGVIASPLIVGTLGEKLGWHWGFGAAGVGMLIGLVIYLSGQKYLPPEQPRATIATPKIGLSSNDWSALIALLFLIPVMAIAIVPNNQIFNAYLVWGDANFDLKFGGTTLPTTWLVTLDAVVSVSFLAIVALFWRWYGKRHREPDELGKMIIGSAFSLAGALCLVMAAATQPAGGKIGLFWPVMFHVLNSIGFANLLPVSLALFARLAPKSINATVIGLYYLAFFAGNSAVGYIGGWLEIMPVTQFWLIHAACAGVAGLVFIVLKVLLRRQLAPATA
ncbi:peptide MFS transporter [Sphingomonas sp. SUN039]|uniref:peptide MFS transporter n=1 Tax=Sphingomonas sp. SUN039 TaxID=2937787 RepID=UPI0021646BBD|nr:peptide MFS transporter [Sphingomonas sp. SUN039]UVO54945.1 peptide MFS transporter [Sphingomonas sp. SUN039]